MTGEWLRAVAAVLVLAVFGSSQLAAVTLPQIDSLYRSAAATSAISADDTDLPPDEALPKRLGAQLSADTRTSPRDRERQALWPNDPAVLASAADRDPQRRSYALTKARPDAPRPCELRRCGNRDPPQPA